MITIVILVVINPLKSRHLKICMISESSVPSIGGQEIFVHELANELTKRGHNVHLIAPKYCMRFLKRDCIPQKFFHPMYKIHRLYTLPLGVLTRFSFFDWRFKYLLWPLYIWLYAKKERFDIIHAHSIFPAATVALLGKLLHIPIVVTSHGDDLQVQPDIGYGARLNAVSDALIKFTSKFINKLVVVSYLLRDLANEMGIALKKIIVIPCFIDFDQIEFENSNLLMTKQGLKKHEYVFYVGRMTAEKGLSFLVKNMETILNPEGPKLVLAGYGTDRQRLENYVKERNLDQKVLFPGIVVGRDKWTLFKNSLAFVIPSTTEAFCITAIEAMATGTVVIARNNPPFSEYIENGVTGILLNDFKDVQNVIKNLISCPEDRLRMIDASMKYVAENFSLSVICSKYEKLYFDLLKKRY